MGSPFFVFGGAANAVSLLELIDQIERLTGYRLQYQTEPGRPADQLFYVTDYSKLCRHTGWKPETDVAKTLELLQQFWEANQGALAHRPPPLSAKDNAWVQLSGRVG